MIFDSDRITFRNWLDLFLCEHVLSLPEPLGPFYRAASEAMTKAFKLETWHERCSEDPSIQRLFLNWKAVREFTWKMEELRPPEPEKERIAPGYALPWALSMPFPIHEAHKWLNVACRMLWSMTDPNRGFPVMTLKQLQTEFGFPEEDEVTLIAQVTNFVDPAVRTESSP